MSTAAATLIPLDQASAGMVLAEALRDAHGAVLLPQGSTLSEASLASLRRRAVASCCVVGAAADPHELTQEVTHELAQQLARLRAARAARLERLFRHSGGFEAGATLLRLLGAYREQQP